MRAAKAAECRHEDKASIDGGGPGKLLIASCRSKQAEPMRPVDRGAGREDATIKRTDRGLSCFLPGDGWQEAEIGAVDEGLAGDHQRKGTCAKGDLRIPRRAAAKAMQRRLLVRDARGDWHQTMARPDRAEITGGRCNLRKAVDGDAEEIAQGLIPCAGCQIHQGGAAGGRHIRDKAPCQAIKEEGIGRSKPQAALFVGVLRLRLCLEDPAKLGCGEIGIKRQAGAAQSFGLRSRTAQGLDGSGAAVVLPDQNGRKCLLGDGVPRKTAFSLIVDANGIQRTTGLKAGQDIGDQCFGIMLDPAVPGIDLGVLPGGGKGDPAVFRKQERAGACRALIDGSDAHAAPSF